MHICTRMFTKERSAYNSRLKLINHLILIYITVIRLIQLDLNDCQPLSDCIKSSNQHIQSSIIKDIKITVKDNY